MTNVTDKGRLRMAEAEIQVLRSILANVQELADQAEPLGDRISVGELRAALHPWGKGGLA